MAAGSVLLTAREVVMREKSPAREVEVAVVTALLHNYRSD